MDNTVTQEVFKRIDAIAEKLGTTAQYLWPKLVAWEYARALGSLILLVFVWALWGFGFYFSVKYRKPIIEEDFGGWVITPLVIVGIVLLIFTFLDCMTIVTGLISPEASTFYRLTGR